MKILFLYFGSKTAIVLSNPRKWSNFLTSNDMADKQNENSRTAVEKCCEPIYQEKIVVITLLQYASNVSPPVFF